MRNNRKTDQSGGLQSVMVAMVLCCVFMGLALAQTSNVNNAPRVSGDNGLAFNGAEVLSVTLEKPLMRADISGIDRPWSQAYMVRLAISTPPAMGPVLELYVGNERIPEYGGWKEGVYFWVYDPQKLQQLNGRPISYRFASNRQLPLGTLDIGDQQQFRQVRQQDLRQQ